MGKRGEFFDRPQDIQPQGAFSPSEWAIQRRVRSLSVGDHSYDAAIARRIAPTSTTGAQVLSVTRHGFGVSQASGGYGVDDARGDLGWAGNWTAAFIGAPASNATSSVFKQEEGGFDHCMIGVGFDRNFSSLADGALAVTLLDGGADRSGARVTGASNGTTRCFLIRKRGSAITAWIDGVPQTVSTTDGFAGAPTFPARVRRAAASAPVPQGRRRVKHRWDWRR